MGLINDIQVLTSKEKDEKPKEVPSRANGKKLLIVEDEKPLLNVLSDRFSREGYDIFKAENGKVGLELAQKHHPDVILLDLLMPVMDGKSMLVMLRDVEELKKIPVIVLTNAGEVENIKITKRYFDAVEFLIKSNVTLDEIVTRVKDFTY
jgi:DNA-binding response OmpR family regulator